MEIIFLSGVGTPVLLIAQLFDYLLATSRQSLTARNARSRSSGARPVVAKPSPDLRTRYDRAA
jgi:hypothetical protein